MKTAYFETLSHFDVKLQSNSPERGLLALPQGWKFISFALIFTACIFTAQAQIDTDSLRDAAERAGGSGAAVSLWVRLAGAYLEGGQPERAEYAASTAEQLARKYRSLMQQAEMFRDLGLLFRNAHEYGTAIGLFRKEVGLRRELPDSLALGQALHHLGIVYQYASRFSEGLVPLGEAERIIARVHADSLLFRILNNLGTCHLRLGDYQAALNSYKRGGGVALRAGNRKGAAMSDANVGSAYMRLGKVDSALTFLLRASRAFEEQRNLAATIDIYNNIAGVYRMKDENATAADYYRKAIALAEENGNASAKAISLLGLGAIQQELGNFTTASGHLLEALGIADSLNNKHLLSYLYNSVGNVQEELGNKAAALSYYKQCLALREEMGNKQGIGKVSNNIANVYHKMGDYEEAEKYYSAALRIQREMDDSESAMETLQALSQNKAKQGAFSESMRMGTESLELAHKLESQSGQENAHFALGLVNLKLHKDSTAEYHFMESLRLSRELGLRKKEERTLQELTRVYILQDDADKALATYNSYLALHESLLNERITRQIAELETQYKNDRQQREIELLQRQKEVQQLRYRAAQDSLQSAEKSRQLALISAALDREKHEREVEQVKQRSILERKEDRQKIQLLEKNRALQLAELEQNKARNIIYIGGMGFALILAIVLFIAYRSKMRTNRALRNTQEQLIVQEKLASLGQLTAGIAHEIQNPLNFVNNFSEVTKELAEEGLEELNDEELPPARLREILRDLMKDMKGNSERVHEHGLRASGIVKQMLSHAHTSSGELQAVDVTMLLQEVINLAYQGKKAQGGFVELQIETDFTADAATVHADRQELGRVFVNILNNAFDAVAERMEKESGGYTPIVRVGTQWAGKNVRITIYDNGIGIPQAVREHIFQPFYTTKPSGKGTGLGLSITYDVIQKKMNGELKVDSVEGEYTTFNISLPLM